MSDLAWLPEAGTAAAILVVVGWFIHFLKGERKDRAAERDKFLEIVTNHIEHSTEASEGLTLAIERLSFKIDERQ